MKSWKTISDIDSCEDCGCSVIEVFLGIDGDYCDGDDARCSECGKMGAVSVVDSTYINWDEPSEKL